MPHATDYPRQAGFTLIAVTLLALFAMLHHPTVGSETLDEAVAEIGRERSLNAIVHGAMIVIVGVYYWAFAAFTRALPARRASGDLALVAAAGGTIMFAGAAVISGFAVPGFAQILPTGAGEAEVQVALRLAYAGNQALALLGTLAYGLALGGWGVALLRGDALVHRGVGALGLAAGALMIGLVTVGQRSLDVGGMTLIVLILGAWAIAAGWWLMVHAPADGR